MKTELKDVLHLYLNSVDVIIETVSEQFKPHFGHAPGHKTQLGPMLYAVILEGGCTVKPILRKLDSMTEEEANEIWRAIDGRWDVTNPKAVFTTSAHENFTSPPEWFEVTRRLLSKSFDLFNLINSQQAIDFATLKNKEG